KSARKAKDSTGDLYTTYDTYDPLNRLTQQTDAPGTTAAAVTSYGYYPSGSIRTMVDPNGNTYTYAYDQRNRLTWRIYPYGSTETLTYDVAGNLSIFKNRAGNLQTFAYDDQERETAYSWDDGLTLGRSMTYDNASNVTSCNTTTSGYLVTPINFVYYNEN